MISENVELTRRHSLFWEIGSEIGSDFLSDFGLYPSNFEIWATFDEYFELSSLKG